MTLAILLVIVAVISLVITVRIAISRSLAPAIDPAAVIEPLDIVAFRNLIDPQENEYLRCRLPAREFRHVQRKRLTATAAYVRRASHNAAFLIRAGETALAANDAATSEAARQLVQQATLLRYNATLALFRIGCAWVWPTARSSGSPILDGYNQLSSSAMLLGRLQNPAASVRILNS
ncbi:MAG TPA: hypothetical protein VKV39_19460 [Candidatus Sulfotelmatobacter sp.]|nr:hypothetical protein [Candidatus Sulfotelmatobacter sp.]